MAEIVEISINDDRMRCFVCKRVADADEIVINYGWCNDCFNFSYSQYIEENAGPHDWILIPNDLRT